MKKFAIILTVAMLACCCFCFNSCTDDEEDKKDMTIYLKIGDQTLIGELENTDAAKALIEKLPITVAMHDYGGWEKVGNLGFSLPRKDKQTTTHAGDFVLYQGDQLVIFYGNNSWSYTRLGKIRDISAEELKAVLGNGDVTVTLTTADHN